MQIKVAFVGNPNCGKTTLFNGFTGAKHKVGNWPGVTVEKKEGMIKHDGHAITLVDLPGIYSISPYSMEEILTREYILNYDPDVVVNVVDGTNLERNLYLTLQLIELGKPVIIALNMMDILESRGYKINIEALEEELSIPVIPVSAVKKKGLTKLIHQIIKCTKEKKEYTPIIIDYGKELEEDIEKVSNLVRANYEVDEKIVRWMSIKIMEQDSEILKKIKNIHWVHNNHAEDIAKGKYDYIGSFIEDIIEVENFQNDSVSDKIDKVLTNNMFGIPIFIFMMLGVFGFTFSVGNYIAGIFESSFELFSLWITDLFVRLNVAEWLISLIVDGAIGGVGGILVFLPNIACLFIAISVLEDSGYMARVALIMDRLMRKIGLNGKAFIPMILGFGCTVPAIMTTRTLEQKRDRLITILITPFMSCSAKIPIYVLFSRVFFPGKEIVITFSLYLLGIIIGVLTAKIFNKILKGDVKIPLIMELPSYKRPSLKTIAIFVWDKVKDYLVRAGTVIFVASVILWFLLEYNFTGKVDMTESLGAIIGRLVAPIFKPLGFGNWEATLALIAGIMGKEIVVSSMSIIYGISETGFSTALISAGFTPISAYTFMVFSLLYIPCVASLGVIKNETKSWKYTLLSLLYQLSIAWVVGFMVYTIGTTLFT